MAPSPDARGAERAAPVEPGATGSSPDHHASAPAGGDPAASAAPFHARGLAAAWAALRPRDGDSPARRAHQATELERLVSALPPAARLDALVELGLYVVTHDGDGDASQFLQSTLLTALARHAAPSAVEQGAMATFARYFDDQHPFTTSRRDGNSAQDAYEDQLTELYSSPAAGLLGYVYLRDVRATGAGDADGLDDAPQRAAVPRYAYLQQTPAFGARSKSGR